MTILQSSEDFIATGWQLRSKYCSSLSELYFLPLTVFLSETMGNLCVSLLFFLPEGVTRMNLLNILIFRDNCQYSSARRQQEIKLHHHVSLNHSAISFIFLHREFCTPISPNEQLESSHLYTQLKEEYPIRIEDGIEDAIPKLTFP